MYGNFTMKIKSYDYFYYETCDYYEIYLLKF